ncbi:MAG: hypothetical protein D3908_03030 [Candidatus Electrothrix sp. AUS4]|nr:hypothetical protein [Candidatus Electrothrix sp. AUS4]
MVVNKVWVHQGAVYLFVFVSIIMPLGIFQVSDFIAARYASSPSVLQILAWLIPVEMSLLCLAWLLDPPGKKKNTEDC